MSDDIIEQPEFEPETGGVELVTQEIPQGPAGRRSRAPLIELAEAAGFDLSDPVDEDIKADHARRWTSRSILVATLLLAALNSPSIQTWATTLPPTWGSQTIDDLAVVWTSRLEQLGLDQPRTVAHDHYQAFQQLGWRDVFKSLRLRHAPNRNSQTHR
jgi:hypothetical protein